MTDFRIIFPIGFDATEATIEVVSAAAKARMDGAASLTIGKGSLMQAYDNLAAEGFQIDIIHNHGTAA